MRTTAAMVAMIVLAAIGTAALVGGAWIYADRQDRLCQVLRGTIEAQAATIGKKGSPGYDYYRQRPDEAAAARRQSRAIIEELDFCSGPPAPEVKRRAQGITKPRKRSRAAVAPARSDTARAATTADDSAARAPTRTVAKRPDRKPDTRPPATINQPTSPPPFTDPTPDSPPHGARPGETPPSSPPRRPTIVEQICDRLSLVPPRVC